MNKSFKKGGKGRKREEKWLRLKRPLDRISHFELFRPSIIMVIVEIENGLYGIMYRPALESVEKEEKNSLTTRNES